MKNEESPDFSKRNMERDIKILQQISCTPKGKNIGLDDLHLLGLHRDCSPNALSSSQDKFEIGWGDSPEPLNIEQKYSLTTASIACKKKLDAKESPKSTCRRIRPSYKQPSKPPIDVSKYIAEVQELSKRIMDKLESEDTFQKCRKKNDLVVENISDSNSLDLLEGDDLTNEYLIACSQSLESRIANSQENPRDCAKENKRQKCSGIDFTMHAMESGCSRQQENGSTTDSAFEKVLQSFISDEDDWLSQIVFNEEDKMKTPRKSNFKKMKSENHLNLTDTSNENEFFLARKSSAFRDSFRRTYSSDRIASNKFNQGDSYLNVNGRSTEKNDFKINSAKVRKSILNDKPNISYDCQRKGFG